MGVGGRATPQKRYKGQLTNFVLGHSLTPVKKRLPDRDETRESVISVKFYLDQPQELIFDHSEAVPRRTVQEQRLLYVTVTCDASQVATSKQLTIDSGALVSAAANGLADGPHLLLPKTSFCHPRMALSKAAMG